MKRAGRKKYVVIVSVLTVLHIGFFFLTYYCIATPYSVHSVTLIISALGNRGVRHGVSFVIPAKELQRSNHTLGKCFGPLNLGSYVVRRQETRGCVSCYLFLRLFFFLKMDIIMNIF